LQLASTSRQSPSKENNELFPTLQEELRASERFSQETQEEIMQYLTDIEKIRLEILQQQ